jgi:transcriptional regulator with GAF, ATPase, and Fis domain
LKGGVFPLDETPRSIGRSESNSIVVDDLAASRNHCSIERIDGRTKLIDLESRNGTFVNGVPVRDRWLEDGDQIRIGTSLFLYCLAGLQTANVSLVLPPTLTRSTSQLSLDDAIYLNSEKLDGSRPQWKRAARDLNALLRISTEIYLQRSRDDFYGRLLELSLKTIPAGRAAVFLRGHDRDAAEFVRALNADGSVPAPFAIDPALLRQVVSLGLAVIAGSPESSELAAGSAILAAPLVCVDNIAGILYLETHLETHDTGARFDDGHLQLLTAIGSIAGNALGNLDRFENMRAENVRLRADAQIQHDMVGESAAMRSVYEFIAKVAPSDASVLIGGENGTGKELAAHAIHRNSVRASQPFVAINCAALTESLLESELFGHEKGAFTGAIALKKGKFELADKGTIFLDEIGELAPAIQIKLLRVLQQREIERVGGTRTIKIDVRLIAATNRDLQAAIEDGTFRQDLYFRLKVISLTMPALRQRRDDIPLLANYFAAQAGARAKRKMVEISEEARAWLLQYDWPGNVRELENAMERAVVLGSSSRILPEDLPEEILEFEPSAPLPMGKYHDAVKQAKREVILRALEQARWVQTEAARLLEIHPVYLHRLIRKMSLKKAASAGAVEKQ